LQFILTCYKLKLIPSGTFENLVGESLQVVGVLGGLRHSTEGEFSPLMLEVGSHYKSYVPRSRHTRKMWREQGKTKYELR